MKNLNGVKEFVVKRIIMKPIDDAIDEYVNFNEAINEVEDKIGKNLEEWHEKSHNDFFIRPIKNMELKYTTTDNDAYEYPNTTLSDILKKLLEEPEPFIDGWTPTSVEIVNLEEKEESISSLKKQIKNCKNPMQLKEPNQKLNAAYKKRKKKN